MFTFILSVFILGILIFCHEAGHFLAARLFGVKVEEFAFGFPPTLWKKKKGETEYKINLIPLGGYVRLLGEEDKVKDPRSYSNLKGRKKIIIITAGVVVNIALAWFLFALGYMFGMSPVALSPESLGGEKTGQIIVVAVEPGSAAEKAGITEGDIINGFKSMEEFAQFTAQHRGQDVTLSIDGATGAHNVTAQLSHDEEAPLGVGLGGAGTKVKLGFFSAFVAATQEICAFTKLIASFLWKIITSLFGPEKVGDSVKDVTGPVGIFTLTGQAVKMGGIFILQWIAILSLNFGLINILPFPALDGGKAIFIMLDGIARRKVIKEEVEGLIHMIGFILLIILILAITYKDIAVLITS